jgi:hypothetical protein
VTLSAVPVSCGVANGACVTAAAMQRRGGYSAMALPQRNRTTYLQNGESHVDDFQGNLIPRKRAAKGGFVDAIGRFSRPRRHTCSNRKRFERDGFELDAA